jgi:hypothetical protein
LGNAFSDPAGVYPWDLEEQKRIIDTFRRRTYYFKKERIAKGFSYGVILDSNPNILWGIGSEVYSACMHLKYPNDLGIIEGSVIVYPRKRADHTNIMEWLGVGIGQETIKRFDVSETNGYVVYDLTINNLVWDHEKIWETIKENKETSKPIDSFIAPFFIHGSHKRPPLELLQKSAIV